MWGFLTVIAFVFAYIYSFDRVERLKIMQELVRLVKLLLESFFNQYKLAGLIVSHVQGKEEVKYEEWIQVACRLPF